MVKKSLLKRVEKLETIAHSFLEEAMALREELSGGSESSVLSKSQEKQLIAHRRRVAVKQ